MIRAKLMTFERDDVHPILGKVHIIDMQVYDEVTGQRLTNDDVYKAFMNFNIVNVNVQLLYEKLGSTEWPASGVITKIDDNYVYLNGTFEVPRKDFLDWYELD